MKAKWDKEKNQVTTGLVRLNLPHLITPKKFKSAQDAVYLAGILVPRKDSLAVKILKVCVKRAEKQIFPNGRPKKFLYPLKSGKAFAKEHELEQELFEDYVIFRAKSAFPPTVVGPDGKTALKEEKYIYSGCNARVVVACKGYNSESKGVGFYIIMAQILAGGESMVSRPDPEDFFDEEADFGDGTEDENEEDLEF